MFQRHINRRSQMRMSQNKSFSYLYFFGILFWEPSWLSLCCLGTQNLDPNWPRYGKQRGPFLDHFYELAPGSLGSNYEVLPLYLVGVPRTFAPGLPFVAASRARLKSLKDV